MTVKELRAVLDGLIAQKTSNGDLPIFSVCGHGSGVSDSIDACANVSIYEGDEEGGEITDEEIGLKYFPIFVG